MVPGFMLKHPVRREGTSFPSTITMTGATTMTNDKDCQTERYLTTDLADETDFFNYEFDEPLARRSQLNEFFFNHGFNRLNGFFLTTN